MSSSSGCVAIPRCPVIFDGANYIEFIAFMRIHMRGIRLWGVLSGGVSCPPCPVPLVAPTPPTPPVLATDASQADKDATKAADVAAVDTHAQQFLDYETALRTYRDDLSAYAQWHDDDAKTAAVLCASVLPQFSSEFVGLTTTFGKWTLL